MYKSISFITIIQEQIHQASQSDFVILFSSNSPASASQVSETTGAHHHTQLNFVFLVEAEFHHVGQAGLKHLAWGDPPASASQSAGITGSSHRAQPILVFSMLFYSA